LRSLSEGEAIPPNQIVSDEMIDIEPVRSKSLSAIPDAPTLDLDSRVRNLSIDNEKSDMPAIQENGGEVTNYPGRTPHDKNALVLTETVSSEGSQNNLYGATTVNSLIDRHDKYPGMGRIETKDIRNAAHEPGV